MKAYYYLLLTLALPFCVQGQDYYYPEKNGSWEMRTPETFDINPKHLEDAVSFAEDNEYSGGRDLRVAIVKGFAR